MVATRGAARARRRRVDAALATAWVLVGASLPLAAGGAKGGAAPPPAADAAEAEASGGGGGSPLDEKAARRVREFVAELNVDRRGRRP